MKSKERRWQLRSHANEREHPQNEFVVRHVAEYHMGWAHILCTAIRQTLPGDHGLRNFIKPYCHGSGSVNWNAYQMLVRSRSILHRASGLSEKGRGHTWASIQKHFNLTTTFPEVLASKGLEGVGNLTQVMPLFKQGMRVWETHRDFVESFVRLLYPIDESLQHDTSLYRFWHHIADV